MTSKKMLAAQVLVFGTFFALPAAQALAAFGEMGSGFGRGGERTPMTVDSCIQKTGKTAAECQTMIDTFKARGQEKRGWEGKRDGTLGESGQGMKQGQRGGAGRFGMETHRFAAIQARIDKIITFLDSKGVNTGELKNDYTELKSKMTAAESDFTTLQTARTAWKADSSTANKMALDSARATAKISSSVVKTYYYDIVLPLLKTLLRSVA